MDLPPLTPQMIVINLSAFLSQIIRFCKIRQALLSQD